MRVTIVCIDRREEKQMVETVLVVDDHALVLKTLVCTLTHAGYRVLGASSSEEALAIAADPAHRIDLLVCDLLLPGMPGTELARRIAMMQPDSRCLFITGMPDHGYLSAEIALDGAPLLAKPFLPHVLIQRSREVLGGACVN